MLKKKIKKLAIIFDFDGVIINSHKVKTQAFYNTFKSYGKNFGFIAKKFHLNNIGKSRYIKFKFILKKIYKSRILKESLLISDKNLIILLIPRSKKCTPLNI